MSRMLDGSRSWVEMPKRLRCLNETCGKKGVSAKSWDCQFCGWHVGSRDAYFMNRNGPESLEIGFYWARRPASWGDGDWWTVVEKRDDNEWVWVGDNRITRYYEIGLLGQYIGRQLAALSTPEPAGEVREPITGMTTEDVQRQPAEALAILRALPSARSLIVWKDGTYRVAPTMDLTTAQNEEGEILVAVPLAEIASDLAALKPAGEVEGEADLQRLCEATPTHQDGHIGPRAASNRATGKGGCTRRATYTNGKSYVCRQHAEIGATPLGTRKQNGLKPGFVPLADFAARPSAKPEVVEHDERLKWFLTIIDAAGGNAPAGEGYGPMDAFCDDRGEDDDTYNLSEKAGWTRTEHSGWDDGGATVFITEAGKTKLAALKMECE